MKTLIACLLLLAGTAASAEELTLEQVAERLPDAPILRADFRQQQHLALLPKPLTATGDLLLAGERGLLWRVRTPFESEIKLIDGTLYSNGQADTLPGGEAFARRLMAVLSGDIEALKPHFRIQAREEGDQWRLDLTPRNDTLARVLAGIRLGGEQGPEFFRLDYPNGDYSVTRLSNIEYPDTLSDAEERRFAAPR